ncbi:MAG: hypothetical protein IJE72_05440 [Clostridia bacterium]|nr:hypothetical protein [Clostridia bacterium]MBQ4603260.1 hypothetical protein [Clostridia bacterium]
MKTMIFMSLAFAAFGIMFAVIGLKTDNLIPTGFGIFFVLGSLFLLYQIIRERKLRKLYEEDPDAYNAMIEAEEEKNPEAQAYEREMEEIEDFDADSGKGYCPHCGNYGVNANKICEACGEIVID